MWWHAGVQPSLKRARTDRGNGSNSWLEQRWFDFPALGKIGGPEWMSTVFNKEPPCLSLHGMQHSGNRVNRIKPEELDNAFHQNGEQLHPARHVLEDLLTKLLDGVRFPPDAIELSWRAEAVDKPSNFKHGDPLLREDDPQVPEDLRNPFVQKYPFKLLNNLADAPAEQPPHFKRHLLRPEQLRSLAWMLAREGCDGEGHMNEPLDYQSGLGEQEPFVVEWRQMVTSSRRSACIDVRAKASYPVRGGILGDRIGFGKTATTIALIDATQNQPMPPVPTRDWGSFIPAKGTLVIVPSNLLDQWAQEISKFVWDGSRLVPLNSGWRAGRSKDGCPLKVLTIGTVSPLRLLTAGELAQADVVLCSYRLLFSRIYQDRREDIAGGSSLVSLMQATYRVMEGNFRLAVGDKSKTYDSTTLAFPILEMFYWRRVVFDEFHELESFQSEQQSVLQHMRAHSRWGLTGTPPIDNIAGVIFMSSLFRCDLPGHLPLEKVASKKGIRGLLEVPNMLYYEQDKLMQEAAHRFLDRFARQNTAEIPHIKLQQHVIVVRHTPAEQALYLAQAYDTPDVDWSSQDALSEGKWTAIESLLKLCSHFQSSGGAATGNAHVECERIGEQKSRRVVQERRQLARCARLIQILSDKLTVSNVAWRKDLDEMVSSLKAQGRPAVEVLAQEEGAAAYESTNERCGVLAGHRPRDEALADALAQCVDGEAGLGSLRHWEAFAGMPLSAREVENLLVGQVQEQIQNLLTFIAAVASQQYFGCVMRALVGGWPQQRSCCICWAEGVPLSRLVVTPCAHSFCTDCLRRQVETFQSCSCCAQPLKSSDVRPLVSAVAGIQDKCTQFGALVAPTGHLSRAGGAAKHGQHGTKLSVLVQKLHELHQEDPTAKVILFVQFDDLKLHVAASLREGRVSAAQLKGSVSQRATIIRDFQENPGSHTFVLLLSLAESASGTNLTAGSHIVFLHPMLASTEERAAAQELQAIGRARRHGQTRDTLHVWRFVTADTAEEAITQRHLETLWDNEAQLKARAEAIPQERPENNKKRRNR